MKYQLRISGKHYKEIKTHLFPGDKKEAVAIVLCGRHEQKDLSILLTHKVFLIPYEDCERETDLVKWKTKSIVEVFEEASKKKMALLKIHSHPNGYENFSETDDRSDNEFFSSAFNWVEDDSFIHGSAILLPDGKVLGRLFFSDLKNKPFDKISIVGDTISIWEAGKLSEVKQLEFSKRTRQAFGDGTYEKLRNLKIGVVGCSGTGSPTIEQLVRLGVSNIVIVDPDKVEEKNLNRILSSKKSDVEEGKYKCDVLKNHIDSMGLDINVKPFNSNLYDSKEILYELITCDVIFGCMDSVDGRHLLSRLTNFYLIPYFDLGVRLDADGKGGVNSIVASVNYIQPGLSSLMTRNLYTSEELESASQYRSNPELFKENLKKGYVRGVNVDRPAVISINMSISSVAVMELINRLSPFKDRTANCYSKVMIDFCEGSFINQPEEDFKIDFNFEKYAGRGDMFPFLRMIELEKDSYEYNVAS